METIVAPIAQFVKGRLSDAGGPRFESQAGRVTSKSTPSQWRGKHPAIKGHGLQSTRQGNSIRTTTKKYISESKMKYQNTGRKTRDAGVGRKYVTPWMTPIEQ